MNKDIFEKINEFITKTQLSKTIKARNYFIISNRTNGKIKLFDNFAKIPKSFLDNTNMELARLHLYGYGPDFYLVSIENPRENSRKLFANKIDAEKYFIKHIKDRIMFSTNGVSYETKIDLLLDKIHSLKDLKNVIDDLYDYYPFTALYRNIFVIDNVVFKMTKLKLIS